MKDNGDYSHCLSGFNRIEVVYIMCISNYIHEIQTLHCIADNKCDCAAKRRVTKRTRRGFAFLDGRAIIISITTTIIVFILLFSELAIQALRWNWLTDCSSRPIRSPPERD
ncbi:hypothetical protein JOB18_023206 [Solea senegalensis]|uniref:Uncharacterized protein n=1 Tax=Solea senegalensis TaxID=28829 RepID=A0AAV6SGV4_SOLSE|nr:hypothetical protein JOB18_023206 [Solea senegalensis]